MILAIDQSYSGTGVAYIASDGRIQADCIKTPSGIPWEARWDAILQALNSYFDGSAIKLEKPTKIKYVVIESYAFSCAKTSSIFQLGELGGIIKYNFHKKGIDVSTLLIQHPKMWVALNGSAKKEDTIRALRTRFGIDVKNDNVADAISIGLTFKAYLEWEKRGTLGDVGFGNIMIHIDCYLEHEKEMQEKLFKLEESKKKKRKTKVKSDLYIGKSKKPKRVVESLNLGLKISQDIVRKRKKLEAKAKKAV